MKRIEPKYQYQYVMLLDDNELDNFINQKILETHHFARKIYTSTSGKSALEFLNNLLLLDDLDEGKDSIFPEMIFIDINMPIMDGMQFIAALNKLTQPKLKKCKLVILTSSMFDDDKYKAKQLREDIAFLKKPLSETQLNQLKVRHS